MLQPEGYGSIPMDLHIPQQGYHPYYRKGHDEIPGPPIVQTRILEMRKEKSRDAARSRRGKENYEFYELAKMLPLPGAITTQLDKASIIRLTISFLKLKEFTAHGDPPWRREGPTLKSGNLRSRSMSSIAVDMFEQHQATHILQSLDGFAFALGADGRFLYISETVSIYLGLSQVEMTGSSVFDYIHQQDQSELADLIGINMCPSPSATSPASVVSDEGSSSNAGNTTPTGFDRPPPMMTLNEGSNGQGLYRTFCVRMKSTLTKRGCHFKSSGYRVVLVLSHLRPQYTFSATARKQPPTIMGLVGLAIALPPPSVNELRLEPDMFVTRLTFDFRISHCEPRVSDLLDYTAEEITGTSMYTLCYAQDAEKLRKCHIDLIQKGQVMSGYYRLMNKNGGYTWLQSCATIICNSKNAEEETIICVNYVLSNVEYPHCVMGYNQLPSSRDLRNDDPSSSERGNSPDKEGGRDSTSAGDIDSEHRPTPRPASGDGEDRQHYDSTTDPGLEGGKHEILHRNTERPPSNSSPRLRDYPSVHYMESPELEPLPMAAGEPEPERYPEAAPASTGRHSRKRKPAESFSNAAGAVDDAKSPRRPESASSTSLDVLAMENAASGYDVAPPQQAPPGGDGPADDAPSGGKGGDKVTRPWTHSPNYHQQDSPNCSSGNANKGIRDLEDAMNRHLPHGGSNGSPPDVLMLKSFAGGSGGSPPQRPIQWIGGPPATLPATTLLRQIYVSRESVIRSGRGGCYGDAQGQGALPTPPGGSQVDDLILQGAYMDNCSAMTPPSSVSPRDKFVIAASEASAFNEAAAVAAAAAMPHMRHYVTDPNALQHLPLKPHQLFVHPGSLDHPGAYAPAAQQAAALASQEQLYHPSGFHLYHPAQGGSKTALHATSNGTSWFCQPHT